MFGVRDALAQILSRVFLKKQRRKIRANIVIANKILQAKDRSASSSAYEITIVLSGGDETHIFSNSPIAIRVRQKRKSTRARSVLASAHVLTASSSCDGQCRVSDEIIYSYSHLDVSLRLHRILYRRLLSFAYRNTIGMCWRPHANAYTVHA